jgi:hypothetical protein
VGRRYAPIHRTIEGVHISVGLTVLLLVVARIVWRLPHRPPPLLADIATWERRLAGSGHALFYILMLALPLTGWAMVSMHAGGGISFWGLPWAKLPGMIAAGASNPEPLRGELQLFHTNLPVWVVLLTWRFTLRARSSISSMAARCCSGCGQEQGGPPDLPGGPAGAAAFGSATFAPSASS